jgi:hypothetical protein
VRLSPAARIVIGAGVPFLAVIPTVPLLNHLPIAPFGIPLGLLWLFAAIPLASLCLAICWFGHDRDLPDEDIAADYDAGGGP